MLAALASLMVAPTFAQAEPVCGATVDQWVGGFDGAHVADGMVPIPLSIEVTQNTAGALRVTTDVDGTVYATTTGSITLKRLSWVILYAEGSFVPFTKYGTEFQGVTCSGGIVTSFTGFVQDWVTGFGFVPDSDFELARVT